MKTKKQYLSDLELNPNEKYSDSDIKSQWRTLTKKYHPDNGSEKNEEKFKLISIASESLISGQYDSENFAFGDKINFNKVNPHDLLNKLNDNFMGVLKKGAVKIEKKSEIIVVNGNIPHVVNIDSSLLTQEKFLKFTNGLLIRFNSRD